MNKKVFLALPALLLLAGCGGSGTSTKTVTQTTPYAGSYAANLTSPSNSAVLVVLQTDGSAQVVIANTSGILASGTGTVSGNTLNVTASGSAGNIQVSTSWSASNKAVSQVTGAATDSNVSQTLIANAGQSPYQGFYNVAFTGSEGGTANMTITATGGLSGSGKTNSGQAASFTGASQLTGLISFMGTIKVTGSTLTSNFTGSLYVVHVYTTVGASVMGSGEWSSEGGGSGTWTAQNVLG